MRVAAAVLAAAFLIMACGRGDGRPDANATGIPAECGLPTPKTNIDVDAIPEELIVEDAVVSNVQKTKGRLIAAINAPYSVQDALKLYRDAVLDANFEIISVDNEGFEAEIYMARKDELGQIQVRMSQCEDASIVFVNLVDRDTLGGTLPTPTPSNKRTK